MHVSSDKHFGSSFVSGCNEIYEYHISDMSVSYLAMFESSIIAPKHKKKFNFKMGIVK